MTDIKPWRIVTAVAGLLLPLSAAAPKGDSPLFAAQPAPPTGEALYAAKIGAVPRERLPQGQGSWDWLAASPESQGMIAARLESAWTGLSSRRTTALLVIRNDRIVFERYAPGYNRTRPHGTASLAKALVGGVGLMVAISDGRIAPDDPASKYVPPWSKDPKRKAITVRHLATHTSGIEDAEADNIPHDQLTGWKGDFWKRLAPPNDPFTLARDVAPVLEAPGAGERYSNPGMAMLGYCVTASLRGTKDTDLRYLLKQRIMAPLGVPEKQWSVGYGTTVQVDGLPLAATWGGGSYSPNAVARVGRLMLQKGNWEGKRLVSSSAVEAVTTHSGLPGHSGLGWWVNSAPDGDKFCKSAPADAFSGAGAGHQFLLVVPSLNLIVVRNGEQLDKDLPFWEGLDRHLVAHLMAAFADSGASGPKGTVPVSAAKRGFGQDHSVIVAKTGTIPGEAPYPASPVIKAVDWAPRETIVRMARDSDNWPITWADDDNLYTAYGDGCGFDPKVPEKLSLGFAKVIGRPDGFSGINVRSATGERKGDGARGKKASGMLMVSGVLYLWVRNAGNSQLAWSDDHGRTWRWCDWKFTTSFGCPTFLNFGRDYAGARDGFVYVYSPDSDSAYTAADGMVLARVPKGRITQRDAYEFYKGRDEQGSPLWTRDVARREAVFRHAGKCYRSGISYSAGLRRYLWCQTLPAGDARFRGGFGIYDAPEPWGPWTTVYHTEQWDVGPGETSSLPPKWMSRDGKTVYLVFSGEDSFSVRRAILTARRAPGR